MTANKKCPHCGKIIGKQKLTLYVDIELIQKAKKLKMNISEFLEQKLNNMFQERDKQRG
jgi:post-segregation antitoxin (ccd killing protein)